MQQEREMMRGSSNNSVLPQQQHQPPQAQKCPRCDSQQTKFCYYNNYSLSQPRHFCKACKRYWTHGGTLRNIPIGGGCRKGKRAKAVVLDAIPPQAPPAMMVSPTVQVRPSAEPVVQFPYYQSGGGYYSTLSGMNHAHPVMNHQIGGEYRSMNSNVGLLQGFTLPGYGSQQLYQMGTINESSKNMMIQPTRTLDQEWSLLNPSTSSDGGVSWDTTGGSSGAAETGNALASLTFCPSPWNDHLSRYDPPNW